MGSWLIVAVPLLSAATEASRDDLPASTRVELRVETTANRESGPVAPCESVQALSASPSLAFSSWSTLGEAAPSEGAPSEAASIKTANPTTSRCGAGTFPGSSPTPSPQSRAPVLVQELTAEAGWEPGAGDPGPGAALQIFLTLRARRLTGFSADGKPAYTIPVTEHRTTRLEPGEEQLVPVPLDARGREVLGVQDVLLRIRAGWAGREGATEYGSLSVFDAAPGSEVFVDGGVAGHAGADGNLMLANLPEGQREVRIRGASGSVGSRTVSVLRGKTVLVTPAPGGSGSPPQPCLTPAGKNQEGFQEYRRSRDRAIMVRIPEGEFLMGNLQIEGAPLPHTVFVSTFLIDKLPLTVARYKRFAADTGRPLPPDPYWGVHDDFPVAFTTWDEAKAYCEWAGGRLPTEAEREKAARGTDGRMFPWGSDPPDPDRAVFGRYWGEEGNDAAGVRPRGASPYGMLDAEGNMWESCEDWWDPDYYASSPKKDPLGAKTGRARVERGGSWDSRWVVLSASRRNFAFIGYREGDFGFRCAAEPPH